MTEEQLIELGAYMWRLARDTNDPVDKEVYKLVHAAAVTLRMGGPISLEDQVAHSLWQVDLAIADKKNTALEREIPRAV